MVNGGGIRSFDVLYLYSKLILPSENPLNALYVLKMSMNSPIDILKDFFYSVKSVKTKELSFNYFVNFAR